MRVELGEGRRHSTEPTRHTDRARHAADPYGQATRHDVGGLEPPAEEGKQVDRSAHSVGLDTPLGRPPLDHQSKILELENAEGRRSRRTPADLHALGPAVGESLREVEIEQEPSRDEIRRGEQEREQDAGNRQPAKNAHEGPVHSRESLACESLAPMGVMERIGTIVVGGGVVGAAVADSLARRGDDVLLVERHSPGHSKGKLQRRRADLSLFLPGTGLRASRGAGGTRVARSRGAGGRAAAPSVRNLGRGSRRILGARRARARDGGGGPRERALHRRGESRPLATDRSRRRSRGAVSGGRRCSAGAARGEGALVVGWYGGSESAGAARGGADRGRRSGRSGGRAAGGVGWERTGERPGRGKRPGRKKSGERQGEVQSWLAARVVLAGGSWNGTLCRALGVELPLRVTRELVAHFPERDRSASPTCSMASHGPDALPAFLFYPFAGSGEPSVYGLPILDVPGVKVGRHHAGIELEGPDQETDLDAENLKLLTQFVEATFPHLEPRPMRTCPCLYTTTPDHDFVLDRVPGEPAGGDRGGFFGSRLQVRAGAGRHRRRAGARW